MNQKSLTPLRDEDYEAIEAAVMETARGRWFLAEFAIRNRSADTRILLDAIQRLENTVRSEKSSGGSGGEMDKVRFELADMASVIDRTKEEIADLQGDTEEGGRFNIAANELDAIVTQTETATQDILNSAETIQELAWTFREAGVDGALCDQLEELVTGIYTACSFQDLTGQRTRKVVNVLTYLEAHIKRMINIWSEDEATSGTPSRQDDDPHPESHLLNGPQLDGQGIDQNAVDDLMSFAGPAAGEEAPPVETVDTSESTDTPESTGYPEDTDSLETDPAAENAREDGGPLISEAHEIDFAVEAEAEEPWTIPETAETAEQGEGIAAESALADETEAVDETPEIPAEIASSAESAADAGIDDLFVTDDALLADDDASLAADNPTADAPAAAELADDDLGADFPGADEVPAADSIAAHDDVATPFDFAAIGETDVFDHEDASKAAGAAATAADDTEESAESTDIALLDIPDDASVFEGFEEVVETGEGEAPVTDGLESDFDDSLPAIEERADDPATDAFGTASDGETSLAAMGDTVAADLSAEELSHADVFASLDSGELVDLLDAAGETGNADAETAGATDDNLAVDDSTLTENDIAFIGDGEAEDSFDAAPFEEASAEEIPREDDLSPLPGTSPDADPFGEVETLADAVSEAARTDPGESDAADAVMPDEAETAVETAAFDEAELPDETAPETPLVDDPMADMDDAATMDAADTGDAEAITPEDLAAMADMLREAMGDDDGSDPTEHLTQAERIALFR